MPALGASGSVNACVIFNIAANPFSTVLIWGLVPVPAFLLGVLWVWSDVTGALVRTLAGCSCPAVQCNAVHAMHNAASEYVRVCCP